MGVPLAAVHAEMKKRDLDPSLLELDAAHPLPLHLQVHPVMLEFTSQLSWRTLLHANTSMATARTLVCSLTMSFPNTILFSYYFFLGYFNHSDFVECLAVVMDPHSHYTIPRTMRIGSPTQNMIDTILEPVLKETAIATAGGSVWVRPAVGSLGAQDAVFLTLDLTSPGTSIDEEQACELILQSLPLALRSCCTTCVALTHPLRSNCVRVMLVSPVLPPVNVLVELGTLQLERGEVHANNNALQEAARKSLLEAGLHMVAAYASEQAGFILHDLAASLTPKIE
jgi:hypothetical protein